MITKCESQIAWIEKEINSIMDYNATIKSRKSDIKSTIELLEMIIQEGEISDANIRMLVNRIIVSEQNGMISIQIKLNAKFTNHIMTYDENNNAITNMLSSSEAVKKDTPCSKQSVSLFVIAFQAVLHDSAEQTTTRYAGAHQMLYKKFPNLGTIRVFRPYCRRKENFYGESI